VAAGVIQLIPIEEETLNASELAVHPGDFKAGLRYLKEKPAGLECHAATGGSIFSICGFNCAGDCWLQIWLKSTQFGFFVSSLGGVGMVLGAAILGHWGDHFHQPLPLLVFLSMAFV